MENLNLSKELFLEQFERYPLLQPQDMLKALFQSEFGCGHFISDEEKGFELLLQEVKGLQEEAFVNEFLEPLGRSFCRVHLSSVQEYDLSLQTLFRLFVLTAKRSSGSEQAFFAGLDSLQEMCDSGELPFSPEYIREFILDYQKGGLRSVHHSDIFRRSYSPAYRVVRSDLCGLMPLFSHIDRLLAQKQSVIIAIDGNCTSGKSTLAAQLAVVYDCNIFQMDSFFLQPHQRTESRLSEPGGNVDYERFRLEVLELLPEKSAFSYRPYDCKAQQLSKPVSVQPKQLNIVEGVYSMHPSLAGVYDLSVFLKIDPALQLKRISRRNSPEMQKRFIEEWIPLENLYFENMGILEKSDLVFDAQKILDPFME